MLKSKLFYLFVAVFVLASCSGKRQQNRIDADGLIGTIQLSGALSFCPRAET